LPTFVLKGGAPALIIDVAIALGMAGSKGEARRLIAQGGVRLNDAPVQSATATITDADLDQNGTARLSVGKKRHGLIRRA
jgi:tyrosyl-tRNA synthetase